MLASAILSLSLFVAVPNSVATLGFQDTNKLPDFKAIDAFFDLTLREELKETPTKGDSLDQQLFLHSCADVDDACLTKIAGALKVRFVIYGFVAKPKDDYSIELTLFDAETQKRISTSSGKLSKADDRNGMKSTIRTLLAVDAASVIRANDPGKTNDNKGPKNPSPVKYFIAPGLLFAGAAATGVFSLLQARDFNEKLAAGFESPKDFQKAKNKVTILSVSSDVLSVGVGVTGIIGFIKMKKAKTETTTTATKP